MAMQTSNMLYRRHEQEWAAFRDAVQQSENQKRNTSAAEETGRKSPETE